MNWKNLFEPHILERGYEYFIAAAVDDLTIKDHLISACVTGSYAYWVKIHLLNHEIIDMTCTCPYANDGTYCKHMAAVLYEAYIEELVDSDEDDYDDSDDYYENENMIHQNLVDNSVLDLIEKASEDLVKAFLVSALVNDTKLLQKFRNIVEPDAYSFKRSDYVKRINNIIGVHMGRDQFINYHKADDFIEDLQFFLDDDVKILIANNDLQSAFELTMLVFQTIRNVEMDDSAGGTTVVANHCLTVWLEILNLANMSVKRTMFDCFIAILDGNTIDYLEEYIENILLESFQDESFIVEKLDFTEKKAREAEKMHELWTRNYTIDKWSSKHLTLLINVHKPESDIENYALKYWKYPSLRKVCMLFYLEQKNYAKAIRILNESIEIDSGLQGLVSNYRLQLKELYLTIGDKESYLEQLWKLIRVDLPGDVAIFKELKSQYSEYEWHEKREIIFSELKHSTALDRLYLEENLFDRLLQVVLDSHGIGLVECYEKVLIALYPAEILNKYKQEVLTMAQPTTNRKQYRFLVSILKHMKKLRGGNEVVDKIAQQWRFSYANRSAMMDELRNL